MSELRVRDHSQPCEHPLDPEGMYDGAYFDDECEYWRCGFGPCPGGKEIVLREAFRWDTQDSLTVDWEPGFNGKPFFVEVVEE